MNDLYKLQLESEINTLTESIEKLDDQITSLRLLVSSNQLTAWRNNRKTLFHKRKELRIKLDLLTK